MSKRFLSFCNHSAILFLEIVAVLLLVFGVIVSLFVWRLSTGPIDLSFAREYIQDSLSSRTAQYEVTFDKAELVWENVEAPFNLQLRNLDLGKMIRGF